ncbi:MAG: ABC transporter permease [Gemmatimonadaceae bacterium]|jgi:simple sugar transport system permease protein|nr:ABC transporter permease [Gemmatimonadaceae bacterium]
MSVRSVLTEYLEGAVRTATPLALAAVGELVAERAGVINIGLEGAIIAGAFGAVVGAGIAGVGGGMLLGVLAGLALGLVFALLVVRWRADQIITGTAITLLALGITGTLYRTLYGESGVALSLPTTAPVAIPGLSAIPVLGRALFVQPWPTYVLYVLVPLVTWVLTRTHAGLAIRAVGERPQAASAAGIDARRVQWWSTLFGGAMGGAAGATLVLAQTGTFVEGMSAGRGFIAIAIVVLGRWHPVGAALAALLFGAASALQFVAQAMGWRVPYQLFLAIPYVVTLLVLATASSRAGAPAALGRAELEER